MTHSYRLILYYLFVAPILLSLSACGTTKWSDTARTGTEQLLISHAIDHSVAQIDFSILANKKVYVNSEAIDKAVDYQYLKMTIRQCAAASGALLAEYPAEADYILEVRAGAVGTDRHDVLIGIPALSVPQLNGTAITSVQTPEVPFAKKTDQRAVVKVAIFAYDRKSGHPLWVSGNKQYESRAMAWWICGSGPFNKGHIYKEARFAGDKITMPKIFGKSKTPPADPASHPQYFDYSGEKTIKPNFPPEEPSPSPQLPAQQPLPNQSPPLQQATPQLAPPPAFPPQPTLPPPPISSTPLGMPPG